MVKHIRKDLADRADALRERMELEEAERSGLRLAGKSALEHASSLLQSVEDSLRSDGARQAGGHTARDFGPRPLAQIERMSATLPPAPNSC